MNRRPSGLTLSKAQVGFLQYKSAEGMSPTTLTTYESHLRLWISCAGDIDVSDVTAGDLRGFIAWLRTEYTPRRVTGNKRPLSPKTMRNYWVTLCSFFTWAGDEFEIANPMKAVPAPRLRKPRSRRSQRRRWRPCSKRASSREWPTRLFTESWY